MHLVVCSDDSHFGGWVPVSLLAGGRGRRVAPLSGLVLTGAFVSCPFFLFFCVCSLTASEIVKTFSGKVLAFTCSPCGVLFLKQGSALQAWRKGNQESPPTATTTAVAALRVTQCKQSLGIDGSGLPKGVCERCYRSARRPPLPVPPSPASSHTSALSLPSPTPPSPLPRAAPCLPCQPLFKPLEERAATAERLLARAHARVRALSEMLATARAASPPSLPQQNALAVGESGNNESLPVAECRRKLRAG